MFTYQRKTTSGTAVRSWMAHPGPLLLSRYNRSSKFDPLVEEVELLEASPQFAHVKFSDGRKDTVSTKLLASCNGTVDPTTSDDLTDKENDHEIDTAVDAESPLSPPTSVGAETSPSTSTAIFSGCFLLYRKTSI